MNKTLLLAAAIPFACFGAWAQNDPTAVPPPNRLYVQTGAVAPPQNPVTVRIPVATQITVVDTAPILAVDSSGTGETIKGSPYSATAITESTQTLADGNHISNKTATRLARDSQGRTRREEDMGKIGPWQANGPRIAYINDPVSQMNYVLDLDRKTATATTYSPLKLYVRQQIQQQMEIAKEQAAIAKQQLEVANRQLIVSGGRGAGAITLNLGDFEAGVDIKTESLGGQIIEGVSATGKRTTQTIPAGQIGNERPIEIVSEVWYSPDLQMVVMSKHSDPRTGETTYRLTDISRNEPDHSLFEVPAGFTTTNSPNGNVIFRTTPGARGDRGPQN